MRLPVFIVGLYIQLSGKDIIAISNMGAGDEMDCIVRIVKAELDSEPIGPNTDCAHYPCHHEGQDCTFCYCPFYPCNDTEIGGKDVVSKKGGVVWSCKDCHFLHTEEVTEYVHSKLRDSDYPEGVDLDALLREVKDRFFYPDVERWSKMQVI